MWFYILISIISGFTLVISRIINSNLAEKIGIVEGTTYNYITGFIISFAFLLIIREPVPSIQVLKDIPVWAYFGGALGIITVMLSSYVTPKISAFYVTILIFVGQLTVGVLIDYFTTHTMSLGKVIGGILVFLGLLYNINLDKKNSHNLSGA